MFCESCEPICEPEITPYITSRIKTKKSSRSVFSSQILKNAEINIACIGNIEENMDLSRSYLAVHWTKITTKLFASGVIKYSMKPQNYLAGLYLFLGQNNYPNSAAKQQMGCLPLAVTPHFCLTRGSQTTQDYSAI